MSVWGAQTVCGIGDDGQQLGHVVSYIEGWSNHYPEASETPAQIGTGWIPPWCVPGHHDTDTDVDTHLGPWLRLDIGHRTVSVWGGDVNNPTIGPDETVSVCLDEEAVRLLRDNLTEWLERTKLHPEPPTCPDCVCPDHDAPRHCPEHGPPQAHPMDVCAHGQED